MHCIYKGLQDDPQKENCGIVEDRSVLMGFLSVIIRQLPEEYFKLLQTLKSLPDTKVMTV